MLIIGNWKAYVEVREDAKKLLMVAKRLATRTRKIRFVVAPPTPFLAYLAAGSRSKVLFAAQDVSTTTVGSATGEVSAATLRSAGATYVIIGHSERRAHGETNHVVAEKVKRALTNGLTPVLCVGETTRDEDARYLRDIREQLDAVYAPLSPRERLQIIVAYEPVWAIGKRAEEAITSHDLIEMILYIRKVLGEYLPGKSAQKASILYGGSVDATNARELARASQVDGFLVGRASAAADSLIALSKSLV